MKKLLLFFFALIACVLSQLYIEVWWMFIIITFLYGYTGMFRNGRRCFFSALLVVFLCWMGLYLFFDAANNALLSNKIAALFSLPGNITLFTIASCIMGIIGGFASLAGYYLRSK
jgi:hypothetical protein